MANELKASYNGSANLYAIVRRQSDGYVWNGTAFEAWADGSIGNYDIPLTASGGDLYMADFPTAIITAAYYYVDYYIRAGGSPATSDLRIDGERINWNGSSESEGDPPAFSAITGYYGTGADIEDVFGTANVTRWSQLDNTVTTADTDRIQTAVNFADAEINNFFRDSRYAVPLVITSNDATVTDWFAKIAGIWLYQNRGQQDEDTKDQYVSMKHRVYKNMRQYKSGIYRLDAVVARADMPTAPVVV